MRKKSHIALARFLVADIRTAELIIHRKAFYLGNILPDCKPSFVTVKHEFGITYDKVKEDIKKLTTDCNIFDRNPRVYWRRLGEVLHYLADYFTFPHNETFDGSLKDHCTYEQELKLRLREYLRNGEAAQNHRHVTTFKSVDALFQFIEEKHKEYTSMKRSVEEDCRYIVSLCQQVLYGMVELLNEKFQTALLPALA